MLINNSIGTIKSVFMKVAFLFKESLKSFVDDNALTLSAALSYYTIFSLPALLIVVISSTGFFFGNDAVSGELFGQIKNMVGADAAKQIQDALKNVKLYDGSFWAKLFSTVILLIGASGVFAEIQNSINYIWGIEAKPKKGIAKFIKNRLMSFSMIGALGFLLMVSLVINSVFDFLSSTLTEYFPKNLVYLFIVLNNVVVFVFIAILFTLIFRTLPDGRVVLRDCIIGATITTVLFMLGKFAIGFYLGASSISGLYGAAGSVILILIWVYYSAIILYFGAEFTKVYATTHGKNIIPNSYAVKITKPDDHDTITLVSLP